MEVRINDIFGHDLEKEYGTSLEKIGIKLIKHDDYPCRSWYTINIDSIEQVFEITKAVEYTVIADDRGDGYLPELTIFDDYL